ncbi:MULTISPECIES: DUF6344 domain-containing protein [Streptomyces]|uniref:DUF6344 domain-containing protein n=1 Tax=Streptomyces solicathayae TaxID=3081768 RepID=A0ABZ0LWS1_9ACTN|nr:DUF6344 domain-containing protein [Streptomyces sp. HUAS YS2]WOX23234.1 DUF6344 domain-containing protein [Streptomyces sp. HUAS YS2]
MAAVKVKQFWTAFISVLVALLGALGLATPASAAQQPAVSRPEEPAADAAAARVLATVPAQANRRSPARDRSLPPTIKQRIRAEAHGATPSVRHLPAAGTPEADPADLTERTDRTVPADSAAPAERAESTAPADRALAGAVTAAAA